MFEKVQVFESRYEELSQKLCDPSVVSSPELYAEVMKEYKSVEPLALKYREYRKISSDIEEIKEILNENDTDTEMFEEEKQALEEKLESVSEEMKILLLPKDPNDDRNVIIEIRGGAGGEEAALFAAVLFRMYSMYAVKKGYKTELINANETELGGYKEISFMLTGEGAYSRLKYESGVHRVQRVPETETQGRIHTSTVTVAVFPEVEEIELTVDPSDLRIDVFHASGHGGQGVNTTDSAVRITHLPTGLVVTCQDERSQLENKAKAMRVLRSRLFDRLKEQQASARAEDRKNQIGSGDRSDRIRTYYFNHDYVVDHRLNLTVNRTANVINGDLAPFIDALRLAEKTEKMNLLNRK